MAAVPGAGRGAVCTSRLEQIFKSTSRFCTQTSPSSSPTAPSLGLAPAPPDERAGCTCLDPPSALLFSLRSPVPRAIRFQPPPPSAPPSSGRPLASPRAELRAGAGWPTELPSDMQGGFEPSTTGSHDGGLDCEDGRRVAHARHRGLAILRICSMLARVVPGGPLRSRVLTDLMVKTTLESTLDQIAPLVSHSTPIEMARNLAPDDLTKSSICLQVHREVVTQRCSAGF